MGSIFKSGIAYVNGGGGKTLKWDEYQALPEAIKMNGDTYYISDIDSYSTDSFAPVIYSESEREIGVWTDGKPLYEKSFTFLNKTSPMSNWADLIEVSYIDHLVSRRGHFILASNGDQLPIGGVYCQIDLRNGYLKYITASTGNTTVNIYLTIQYTKTADIPGSGSWTPQGVPAIHYSFDEHVVGTWVDGSTIYERTDIYSGETVINSGDWRNTPSSGMGIAKIIDVVCYQNNNTVFCFQAAKINNNIVQILAPVTIGITGITIRYTKSS